MGMDAWAMEKRNFLTSKQHQEETQEWADKMLTFYTMRRNAAKVAMKTAQTTAAYEQAKLAHGIYTCIITDITYGFGHKEAPVQLGGEHGGL